MCASESPSAFLPRVRQALLAQPGRARILIRLQLPDGSLRELPCPLVPEDPTRGETIFLYTVFNALAVYSARELTLFVDSSDPFQTALLPLLEQRFQLQAASRSGYGKAINIAQRLCTALGAQPFRCRMADLSQWTPLPPSPPPAAVDLPTRLRSLLPTARGKALVGIDVGGTDIKLAAARDGRLVCVKEFDWDPSHYPTAEQILDPILLLVQLMRACLAWENQPLPPDLRKALERSADLGQIRDAVTRAEAFLGDGVRILDGVGVSFPDVVIDDRILGGETPKTKGMRENTELPYEPEFSKLSRLKDRVLELCKPGGVCRICNDGSMAAFTAGLELACGQDPEAVQEGVIAHTLGTDLGTGWLSAEGRIPQIPLELYDLLLDLETGPAQTFSARDLRSTRNDNSGLCGVRRYLGQAAAFRLAWELDPGLLEGFVQEQDGLLLIPEGEHDLRKPCLEHLMARAEAGVPAAEEIFRRIGRNLAMVCLEMDYLASPRPKTRWLFGRFIRSPRCFALLCQGFDEEHTGLRLLAADQELANTPLMRALAQRSAGAVAQFGQAVGAVYYSML